jgi:cob(I)alamin adenosyltransferase
MRIYTKTGDKGETSLFGGKRVPKDALRIEAYGTVDELNSLLGLCRSLNPPSQLIDILVQIQNDLFVLGGDLAAPSESSTPVQRIQQADVDLLERTIDEIDPKLEPLRSFILPGGTQLAATLHAARAVCRRAERLVVRLAREEPIGEQSLIYLNRLSDLLFVLARHANRLAGQSEVKWDGGRR